MGLFGKLFCRKKVSKTEETKETKKEITFPDNIRELTKLVVDEFIKNTSIPSIVLKTERRKTGSYDSKLGGLPYMPKNFIYPCNSKGEPLKLLAQLNFSELPKLLNYPQKGILQFFVLTDEMIGVNFDDLSSQDSFRIIYHDEIVSGELLSDDYPDIAAAEWFPFQGEFALVGEKGSCPMTEADYRFNDEFLKVWRKHTDINIKGSYELGYYEDIFEPPLYEALDSTGIRIGGYPYFTQEDPREYASLTRYDTLLFQIDSGGEGNNEIMWGDSGVANFFINLEDLKVCDFSKVIYTWDCC